jgi:hypothetical protein
VDPVLDPLLLRKSGSAGNQIGRFLCISYLLISDFLNYY